MEQKTSFLATSTPRTLVKGGPTNGVFSVEVTIDMDDKQNQVKLGCESLNAEHDEELGLVTTLGQDFSDKTQCRCTGGVCR